ncbi:MAG TPA: sulfotransferase [Anaerolineales bacterium]|nr:sulfotransferase [Anaerolineales bacterium]
MTTRRDLLAYSLDCNRGYVETSPQATFLAPLISTIIPEVRFIYLVRDPREVVRSGMRRRWFNGNPADGTRISPLMDSPIRREWETYTAFQKNLWLWAESNRWILRFLSSFPQERQLFLRSEDVFSADKDVLASLFTFIHASLPPITKVNRLLDQKLNAQQSGEFPDVSAWTREMYKDLIKIAGEVAGVLGYDLHSGSQTG